MADEHVTRIEHDFYGAWRQLHGQGYESVAAEAAVDMTDDLQSLLTFCAGAAVALELLGGPDGRTAGENLTAASLVRYEVEKLTESNGPGE